MNTFVHTIVSVSTLTQTLKKTIENTFLPLWVRGEISNLKVQSSGHAYFTLKDKHSQISIVLFKGSFPSNLKLRDGLECIIYGEVTVYEPRGTYQIIARLVVPEKEGLLQLEFQKLKQRLEDEGYFQAEHKKAIPTLVRNLGVITSPTGAALQDFISVLKNKGWKGKLIVFPAKVQSKDAPTTLIQAIAKAQRIPGLEALVLTRGGGSVEDLWCFNDEALVKAMYACAIPIVSAIGHEVDFTLADFVADLRLPTPTAAAEFFADHYQSKATLLAYTQQRFIRCKRQGLNPFISRLARVRSQLSLYTLKKQLSYYLLYLNERARRLYSTKKEILGKIQSQLEHFDIRISHYHPRGLIAVYQEKLHQVAARLEATSPQKLLQRGYALLKNAKGQALSSIHSIGHKDRLWISLKDGTMEVKVLAISEEMGSH